MLKIEKVSKSYQSGKVKIKALDDISVNIGKGEFVILKGPSGSGKTTFLNISGLLTKISNGCLWISDQEVSHLPDHFISQIRREKIGFIFQQFNLLSGYKTWENVAVPLIPLGVSLQKRKEKAIKLLEILHLETRAYFMANELSGGEQQRAAFARALINDPELILADEPFSNIGHEHIEIITDIFAQLKKEGKTIIISLHHTQPQIIKLTDQVFHFKSGKMVLSKKNIID